MLQEDRADSRRRREAELDNKLTLPDFFYFTVSLISEVRALFTTQRDTQLNAAGVSQVPDMSTLPKL